LFLFNIYNYIYNLQLSIINGITIIGYDLQVISYNRYK